MRHIHFADTVNAATPVQVVHKHDHGDGEYHDHPGMTVAYYSFNEPEETP